MSEPVQQYPEIGDVKKFLEDCLEDIHSKLVETGNMDTPLGKAFACIFENPATVYEVDEKSPASNISTQSQAQELYAVSREGAENFQPLPVNGAKPWKYLQKIDLAPLGSWTLRRQLLDALMRRKYCAHDISAGADAFGVG
ncbi:hypothetical protein N7520_011984 [Penicillium odoratum]|uniref:uncharacterized protein n=1 Tax=Penicillium odoratum TaxID=1167516 RepID=UPI0025487DE6|nr:uncharacterized protein N7520_011984 [Penicillium odoratum]KAJ5746802.1 hypothetical protein N7520_011984 [Penicillium odoratum]